MGDGFDENPKMEQMRNSVIFERAGRRRRKGEKSGGKTEEIIIVLRAYHLAAIAGNL